MQLKTLVLAALAASGAFAHTSSSQLASIVTGDSSLTVLAGLLTTYPEIATTLATAHDVTVLAPSDKAFMALNDTLGGTLGEVVMDRKFVEALLSYHVLCGVYTAEDFKPTPQFPKTTLTNHEYTQVTGGQVVELQLNEHERCAEVTSGLKKVSKVTQPNIRYSGGIVHIIDAVLTIPPNVSTTAAEENLSALLDSVKATGLTETLDTTPDLTIFAPSNAAFKALGTSLNSASTDDIANILKYHVIKGTVAYSSTLTNTTVHSLLGSDLHITVGADGNVYVNNAQVVIPDVLVSNGVVHVIDAVLNPNETVRVSSSNTTMGSAPGATAYSGASSAAEGTMPVNASAGMAAPTTTPAVAGGYVGNTNATSSVLSYTGGSPHATGVVVAAAAAALFGGAALLLDL